MEFEMPRPGPEHEALARLCGRFDGHEVTMPSAWSPERKESTSTITARMLDGFFVISDYEQHVGDQVTYRGHGVYSWDPQAGCYKMYWFDSMGGPGGIADGQLDGDVLTFENNSPTGRNRYRYTFYPDHIVFEMAIASDGGDWATMMEATFRPSG